MKSSSGVFLVKKKRQILAKLKHFTNCFDLPSFSSGEKRQKKIHFLSAFSKREALSFFPLKQFFILSDLSKLFVKG